MFKRNYSVEDIIEYVAQKTGVKASAINIKYCQTTTEMRSICAFFFRCLCNLRCKDICKMLCNITQSRVSKLFSMGFDTIYNNEKYRCMLQEYIEKNRSAQ